MTTHNMKEAETLCEEVAFIKSGMIKARGRPQDLKRELRLGDPIVVTFRGTLPSSSLEGLEGIYGYNAATLPAGYLVDDHRERLPQILDLLTGAKVTIHDLRIQESDLEDVFIAYAR